MTTVQHRNQPLLDSVEPEVERAAHLKLGHHHIPLYASKSSWI